MVSVQYVDYMGDMRVLMFESVREFVAYGRQYPDLHMPWVRIVCGLGVNV